MRRGLSNLIIYVMIWTMSIPAQLFADESTRERRRAHRKETSQYSGWDFMGSLSNTSTQFINQYQQQQQMQMMQGQSQQRAANLAQELAPKTPAECASGQVKNTALCMAPSNIFPSCMLLPTKLPTNKTCESPLSISNIMEAQQILLISERNQELYSNGANTSNNESQMNGIECMVKGKELLEAQLNERLKKIDDLKLTLQEADASFTEKMNIVQDGIKKQNSLITGEPYEGADNDTALKVSDLFQDNTCKSVHTFNDEEGGLRGFEKSMMDFKDKDNVKRIMNQSKSIDKDIRKMANKLAKKIKKGNLRDVNNDLLSSPYSSTYDINSSKVFTNFINDVKATNTDKLNKIDNEYSELGNLPGTIAAAYRDEDPSRINQAIKEFEISEQEKCMKDRFTIFDNVAGSITNADSRISKASQSAKLLGQRIQEVLDNSELTLRERRAKIIEIEKERNPTGKMYISLEQEIGGQSPGYPWSVSGLFSTYLRDCETIWNSQKDYGTNSGVNVVKKVKSLQNEYQSAHYELQNTFETQMIDKLINCGGAAPEITTNTCNEQSLSITGDANFCLKGAQQCASNITACASKAKTELKKARQAIKISAVAYNNEITTYKKAQYTRLKMEIGKFRTEAEALNRGLPGLNFSLPEKLNLGDKKTFLALGQDPKNDEAKLIDHKDYLPSMIASLDDISAKIKQQNTDAIKFVQDKIKNINENYNAEATRQGQIAEACRAKVDEYNMMVAQQNQKATEDATEKNAQINAFCSAASGFNAKPGCGNAESLVDDSADVLSFMPQTDAGKLGEIREYKEMCNNSSNSDDGSFVAASSSAITRDAYCKDGGPGASSSICEEYILANDMDDKTTCVDNDGKKEFNCIKLAREAASEAVNNYNLFKQQETAKSEMGEKAHFELCTSRSMNGMDPAMKGMSETLMDLNDTTNPFGASMGAIK